MSNRLPLVWVVLAVAGTALAVPPLKGAARAQDDAEEVEPSASMSLVRSVQLPSAQEIPEGQEPTRHGMDTYVDWDLGVATLVHESGSLAALPLRANWTFSTALTPVEGLFSLALQRTTGLSFFLDDGEWTPIAEPEGEELVIGDYEAFLGVVDAAAYGLRFDRFTGRSWLLDEGQWQPLAGNLEGWPLAVTAGAGNGAGPGRAR